MDFNRIQTSQRQAANFRWYILSLAIGVFVLTIHSDAFAQTNQSGIPQPTRLFTVYVQVSLPDGKPAPGSLVSLESEGGGGAQKGIADDHGRVEFLGVPEGAYKVYASSFVNPKLISQTEETNPSRTAQGNLTVVLNLRDTSMGESRPRPGVVRAGKVEIRVPNEAKKSFVLGLKFKQNKDIEHALESFTHAIELFPSYAQAFSERGDIYVTQRKLDAAETDFEAALKIDDQYGPALRGDGFCKLEKREFAAAAESFNKSILAEPDNANTYLLLGIANLELDRRDQAKQALQRALSMGAARAHIYMANLFALEHQFKEAADEIDAYLEAEPKAVDADSLKETAAKWRAMAGSKT